MPKHLITVVMLWLIRRCNSTLFSVSVIIVGFIWNLFWSVSNYTVKEERQQRSALTSNQNHTIEKQCNLSQHWFCCVHMTIKKQKKRRGHKRRGHVHWLWQWTCCGFFGFVPRLQIPQGRIIAGPWVGRFRCRHKRVILHVLLSVANQTDTQTKTGDRGQKRLRALQWHFDHLFDEINVSSTPSDDCDLK